MDTDILDIQTPTDAAPTEEQPTVERDRVTFTADQQEKVNAIAARTRNEVRRQYAAQLEQERAETAELRNRIDALAARIPNTPEDEINQHKAKTQQLETLTKRQADQLHTLQMQAEQRDLDAAIERAVSQHKFIAPGDVAALHRDKIMRDPETGEYVERDPRTGQPRIGLDARPIGLEKCLTSYANQKPHMVQSQFKSGLGTTPTTTNGAEAAENALLPEIFGKNSNAAAAMALKRSNPAKYAELKQRAIAKGLL